MKSYPNIKIVSRDGSIAYHNSISDANSKAIQISDRFHLFKNLTAYAIEYLKKHLKKIIEVLIDNTDTEVPTAIEINQTRICREVNMDVRGYKKLIAASDEERTKMFSTVANTKHENRVLNKINIVSEVRDLKSRGLSKSAISRETGLDHRTISKYLDKNFAPVHASYGVKKGGILSAFYKDIDNLCFLQ